MWKKKKLGKKSCWKERNKKSGFEEQLVPRPPDPRRW